MNEASSGYFLDTNLWLSAFLETETGNDKQQIARSLINSQGVVVSTQVINEVCVNLIKKALLDEEKINHLIQDFYSRCRVVEFNQQVLLNASKLRQSYDEPGIYPLQWREKGDRLLKRAGEKGDR